MAAGVNTNLSVSTTVFKENGACYTAQRANVTSVFDTKGEKRSNQMK